MNSLTSISAIADLHGHLPYIPPSDLAIVAGDIFPGELDKDPEGQGEWFRNTFLPWVNEVDCGHVVLIAGNHDHWIAANNEQLLKEYAPEAWKKLIYLCDSGFEYKGLIIYGTPWMPHPFRNKAFSLCDNEELREKYSHIPQNVDLLITHTLPYDCNYIGFSDRDMLDLGSKELRKAIETRNIRFLVGGHIHETRERIAHMDFGERHTEMANVACCDNDKQPIRLPIRFALSIQPDQMRIIEQRIRQDFSLALSELEFNVSMKEHPVYHELQEAEKELEDGIEKDFRIEWRIVDIDESHIYVTNLNTGDKYHISVIYPAALYVDVYRILENGEEISPWNYVPFDWSMATDKTLWLTPCEESYYYIEKWRSEGRRSVLDMGCGLGRHSILFAKNGFDVTALDISDEALSFLEKEAGEQDLKISCVLARMESMPFPDNSFDCIFAMHSAGHAYTAGMYKIMSEIMRVLKPGGAIFITLCSKETRTFTESGILKVDENTVIKTDGPELGVPHFFADKDDIEKLFSGFELVTVRHIDDCYSEGKWKNQKHYFIEARKK